MIDSILLIPTNPILSVIPLSLIYVFLHKRTTVNLIFTFLFISVSLNALLKFFFQIPLHSSLNNQCWWALPSGHMQYGIVFWGIMWIHQNYNLKVLLLFIVLLIASGWKMNLNNYHTLFEMICAIPPAIIILILYALVLKRIDFQNKNHLFRMNILSIIFQLIIMTIVKSPCLNYKLGWMWLHLGASIVLMSQYFLNSWSFLTLQSLEKKQLKPISVVFTLLTIQLAICFAIILKYNNEFIQLICGIIFIIVIYYNSELYKKLIKQ